MKRRILGVLVILGLSIVGADVLKGAPQETGNKDNYGKVIGQIIDPETEKPVNEEFGVCFFNWNYKEYNYRYKKDCTFSTDEKGYIATDVPPGTYGLLFYSKEANSKYSDFFHPFYEKMPEKYKEMFSCPIKVEKGKITKFVKKAIVGGTIKITLVDLTGNPVDPDVAFPGRLINIDGYFENYILAPGSHHFNFRLKGGQVTKTGFFPDTSWEMELEFHGIGYGKITKKNIVIKANEVTEITVAIDLNNITGVEGKIMDELGNPIKNVRINFYQKDQSIEGDFECFADSNGHFHITGMPEGFYKIEIFDGHKYYLTFQNVIIEIKKNILLHKDFILPISEY
jgi:hypothetical protein